jgi:hypothetical protein
LHQQWHAFALGNRPKTINMPASSLWTASLPPSAARTFEGDLDAVTCGFAKR